MAELLGLLAASFLASTLVPLPSEAALYAYLQAHPERTALAVALATLGNTAGGMTSYLIGRFIPQKGLNPKAMHLVRRWGAPATFLAGRPPCALSRSRAAQYLKKPRPLLRPR